MLSKDEMLHSSMADNEQKIQRLSATDNISSP